MSRRIRIVWSGLPRRPDWWKSGRLRTSSQRFPEGSRTQNSRSGVVAGCIFIRGFEIDAAQRRDLPQSRFRSFGEMRPSSPSSRRLSGLIIEISAVRSRTSTPQGIESTICCRSSRIRSFSARLVFRAAFRSDSSRPKLGDFLLQCAIGIFQPRSRSDEFGELAGEEHGASGLHLGFVLRASLARRPRPEELVRHRSAAVSARAAGIYWFEMRTRQHLPIHYARRWPTRFLVSKGEIG